MSSTPFISLSLFDYEISPEQGFLPPDPCENLPDCTTLNHLGHELPKLLSARTVRRYIHEQRQLLPSIPRTWRTEDYRTAMRKPFLSRETLFVVGGATPQPATSHP